MVTGAEKKVRDLLDTESFIFRVEEFFYFHSWLVVDLEILFFLFCIKIKSNFTVGTDSQLTNSGVTDEILTMLLLSSFTNVFRTRRKWLWLLLGICYWNLYFILTFFILILIFVFS